MGLSTTLQETTSLCVFLITAFKDAKKICSKMSDWYLMFNRWYCNYLYMKYLIYFFLIHKDENNKWYDSAFITFKRLITAIIQTKHFCIDNGNENNKKCYFY